jgi:hypothetical protein
LERLEVICKLFDLEILLLRRLWNISLDKESVCKALDIAWFCKIPTGFASVQSYENEHHGYLRVYTSENRQDIASKTMDCVAKNQTQRALAASVHCKKRPAVFPSPAGMSLIKLSGRE